jgi:epoxyqueuosine reductase QueG
MNLNEKIEKKLKDEGVDFVHCVDISSFPNNQTQGFSFALVFGAYLSPEYIQKVSDVSDYVENMKSKKLFKEDEFANTEQKMDFLADILAEFLVSQGYEAYSQSEKNIADSGFYDFDKKRTPLPHKTLARKAGVGWLGKNNLLVTPGHGSALSMCSVLTNAPLETFEVEMLNPKCGSCTVCFDVCEVFALKGKAWSESVSRDEIINVDICTTCLKCMMLCPWTQKYLKQEMSSN